MKLASPLLLAAAGAALLAGCLSSPADPDNADGEPFITAGYTLLGDRIVVQSPPDTDWTCAETGRTLEIEPNEPDTNRFTITGNTLRIFNGPDTLFGDASDDPEAVVDRYAEMIRTSGGRGLEGRWQLRGNGYSVLAGALSAETKADFERSEELDRHRFQYVTFEYEFSDREVRAWFRGDFAGLYVAGWNGDFKYDSLDVPDSARYDIEVAKVDPGTVRLKGRKSGETVTLTFEGPRKSRTYASDNPAHAVYSENDATRPCDVEPWFRMEFLEDNRRGIDEVLKPGADSRASRPGRPAFPFRSRPFFPGLRR